MGRYIRKRLLQAVPVVFGITILTFFIMKMAPGGPLTGMISPRTSSESLQRAREALGLNDPIIVQYWNWLKQLVQGNFGYSTYNGQAVLTEILDRLPGNAAVDGNLICHQLCCWNSAWCLFCNT